MILLSILYGACGSKGIRKSKSVDIPFNIHHGHMTLFSHFSPFICILVLAVHLQFAISSLVFGPAVYVVRFLIVAAHNNSTSPNFT